MGKSLGGIALAVLAQTVSSAAALLIAGVLVMMAGALVARCHLNRSPTAASGAAAL